MTHFDIAVKGEPHWLSAARSLAAGISVPKVLPWLVCSSDAVAAGAAYFTAFDVAGDGSAPGEWLTTLVWPSVAVLTVMTCLAASGAYRWTRPLFEDAIERVRAPLVGTIAGSGLLIALQMCLGRAMSAESALIYMAAAAICVTAGRVIVQLLLGAARHMGYDESRIFVVYPEGSAERYKSRLERLRAEGFTVCGIFQLGPQDCGGRGDELTEICRTIADAAHKAKATEILVCDGSIDARAAAILAHGLLPVAKVRIGSPLLAELARDARLAHDRLGDAAVLEFGSVAQAASGRRLKKAFDYAFSIAALAVLAPLWALLAPVLVILQGRPVFFRQQRVNTGGGTFVFYKLRTMVNGLHRRSNGDLAKLNILNGPMFKCPTDPRTTGVGRWLRRFSLDETPQFYNVARGDISVVGVRPPLPEEVEEYEPWHRARLSGRMGITGLWQVSGRSNRSFDEIVLLDMLYNSNCSIAGDIRIIWQTASAVLSGRGAY